MELAHKSRLHNHMLICMLAINKAGRHAYISIYHISYSRLCRIVNLKIDEHQWKND
jgi:hypothetical protein